LPPLTRHKTGVKSHPSL